MLLGFSGFFYVIFKEYVVINKISGVLMDEGVV